MSSSLVKKKATSQWRRPRACLCQFHSQSARRRWTQCPPTRRAPPTVCPTRSASFRDVRNVRYSNEPHETALKQQPQRRNMGAVVVKSARLFRVNT